MEAAPQRLPAPRMPDFLLDAASRGGQRVQLDAGRFFIHCGQDVDVFAVVLRGSLRVFVAGENGREITLYGVEPGECCMVNVLCLISGTASPAAAVVDEPVEAVLFPRKAFLEWLHQRADLREFVFGVMACRVTSMMALVEEVAFQRLDCRLAGYLCQRAGSGETIQTTHEAVAADLGTAREVVSRLLKSFERRGAVSLARGSITVREPGFLRDLALGGS
ncbi:MAG: Crp/Fnr family transcriptional regulator [Candidatus Krumholzibacteriia bacterium]